MRLEILAYLYTQSLDFIFPIFKVVSGSYFQLSENRKWLHVPVIHIEADRNIFSE